MDKPVTEADLQSSPASRVTPADIAANIASEHYFTAAQGASAAAVPDAMVSRFLSWPVPASVFPDGTPGQPGRTGTNLLSALEAREMLQHVLAPEAPHSPLHLLTFCVLVLRNGFTVTGESACAAPENFDAEMGRRIARENAVAKVYALMGYELKTRLAQQAFNEQEG